MAKICGHRSCIGLPALVCVCKEPPFSPRAANVGNWLFLLKNSRLIRAQAAGSFLPADGASDDGTEAGSAGSVRPAKPSLVKPSYSFSDVVARISIAIAMDKRIQCMGNPFIREPKFGCLGKRPYLLNFGKTFGSTLAAESSPPQSAPGMPGLATSWPAR